MNGCQCILTVCVIFLTVLPTGCRKKPTLPPAVEAFVEAEMAVQEVKARQIGAYEKTVQADLELERLKHEQVIAQAESAKVQAEAARVSFAATLAQAENEKMKLQAEEDAKRQIQLEQEKKAALADALKRERNMLNGASAFIVNVAVQLDDMQREYREADKEYAQILKDWDTLIDLFGALKTATRTTTNFINGAQVIKEEQFKNPPRDTLNAMIEHPVSRRLFEKYPEFRFKDCVVSAIEELDVLEKQWRITEETFRKNKARAGIELNKLKNVLSANTESVNNELSAIGNTIRDLERERAELEKKLAGQKDADMRKRYEAKIADLNIELTRTRKEENVYRQIGKGGDADSANMKYTRVVNMNAQENDMALQNSIVVTGISAIRNSVRMEINRQMSAALREARVKQDTLAQKIESAKKLLELSESGQLPTDTLVELGDKIHSANVESAKQAVDTLLTPTAAAKLSQDM